MWWFRPSVVALAYAWLARMPVCTVMESCAQIVLEWPVDSFASPQATVNSVVARMLHATPVECGHVKGGYGHRAIKLEGSMCTHRLVPYTPRHALLFCKYSRYAVFLNCFSNSGRCLWGEAWSGRYVLVCVWTNSSIAYMKWNLARFSKNASCAT